jgi:hypothetical protein
MCLTKKIALFFGLLSLLGCGCKHHIGYSLEKSDRWKGPAITGVVCVQPITDHANLSTTNCQVQIDKKTWMTNFRKGYNNTNLTAAVTAMMVKHLAYSGLFTKVVSGTNVNADYYLSGTLTDYEARGLPNKAGEGILLGTAFLGGLGGAVIGSISTSGMKSDYESTVKLTDLNLADKNGQSLWHDSICISTNFSAYFGNADPIDLCSTPDGFLKNAVSEMIYRLGNSPLTNRASAVSH